MVDTAFVSFTNFLLSFRKENRSSRVFDDTRTPPPEVLVPPLVVLVFEISGGVIHLDGIAAMRDHNSDFNADFN